MTLQERQEKERTDEVLNETDESIQVLIAPFPQDSHFPTSFHRDFAQSLAHLFSLHTNRAEEVRYRGSIRLSNALNAEKSLRT